MEKECLWQIESKGGIVNYVFAFNAKQALLKVLDIAGLKNDCTIGISIRYLCDKKDIL